MIGYKVVAVYPEAVELWDGESMRESGHHTPATMLCPVQNGSRFEVGDVVDLVVVLRERSPKKESR